MRPTGETTREAGNDGALPVVLYLAPWAFVLLAALKLKHRILASEGGGFDFLAELLGVGHGGALSTVQRVSLYRDDVLLMGVMGSIAFIALIRLIPIRGRAFVAWFVSTALFLILYAQLKSWWEVGTFISANLMTDALFGSGKDLIGEYAVSRSVMKLFASVVVIALVCIALHVMELRTRHWRGWQALRPVSWALAGAGAIVVLAAMTPRIPSTPFDRSATTAALSAFVGRSEAVLSPPDVSNLTPQELVARYAKLAHAPVPNGPSAYFGKARGYDVVFLLLESLPEACYAIARTEGAVPNMASLEQSAFIATAHYSTYPYSRRAYTSIFSSWYPLNGIRGAIERLGRQSRELRTPGVVHSADVEGYETVAFVPERPVGIEEDELRYEALGFEDHEVPTSAYAKPEGFQLDDSHRDWVRTRDRESFDSLKSRVRAAIDANQRYMYSFNPQLTHGPWPGISSESSREETCRAGFGLLGEIDAKVGELVALLKERKRLDKTLIVFMGDHGLRTRREYPPFHAGTLDDVTFRVPLVLYAPGAVTGSERIPWMTSHIDIAPSVLDLLGITVDRGLELGSPMWDPRVADRATYFFAKGYLGADGYQHANEAVMVRYLYGGVSRSAWNGVLRFKTTDLLKEADSSLRGTVSDLNLMAAIQERLTHTMLPGESNLATPPVRRRDASGSVPTAPKAAGIAPAR